jgi:molybdopterin synthase sulfur carrier subunit
VGKLKILYFAWIREAIGIDGESLDHPGADMSVRELIAMLSARSDSYAEAFTQIDRVRAALDQSFVPLDAKLGDASELALFPPVTGG